jgi:hypothetical protein
VRESKDLNTYSVLVVDLETTSRSSFRYTTRPKGKKEQVFISSPGTDFRLTTKKAIKTEPVFRQDSPTSCLPLSAWEIDITDDEE